MSQERISKLERIVIGDHNGAKGLIRRMDAIERNVEALQSWHKDWKKDSRWLRRMFVALALGLVANFIVQLVQGGA